MNSPITWRKSSHSGSEGGECVEIASWRKSSYSGGGGGDCIEVARVSPQIAVRDSKDPEGPKLVFDAADWCAFARRVKAGTEPSPAA